MSAQFPLLDKFVAFVTERWELHLRRKSGAPPPWTADPILCQYKFCNVRREDDRVTRWVHNHWLYPHQDDPMLWFAMYFARVFNNLGTLEDIGYPVPWTAARRAKLKWCVEQRKANGLGFMSRAYMVTTHKRKVPVLGYYCDIFDELWASRRVVSPYMYGGNELAGLYAVLRAQSGLGSFMAAQVVADCKWTPALLRARDWRTFAASGPGSRRGLNRLCGAELRGYWNEENWHAGLLELRTAALPKLPKALQKLDAQNLQNCLCEFDKYRRIVEDPARRLRRFKPSEEKY